MTPKERLRSVLKRIKKDAERAKSDLRQQGDEHSSDRHAQKYYSAAYRLECLLVHVNSELDDL